MRTSRHVLITEQDRIALEQVVRSGKTPQKVALRARIVLLSADGVPTGEIMARWGTTAPTITRWRNRYETAGVPGLLQDRSRPGRKRRIDAATMRAVVERTLQEKPPGATHWSTRSLAKMVGVSDTTVQRIWKAHGLKPHRVRTFKLSRDPRFVEKLRDVDTLLTQAKALGSLSAALSQVEEKKRRAERALAQAAQARAEAQKEAARLSASVKDLKGEAAGLVAEIDQQEQEADELSLEIRARRGDVEMVKRWLAFLDDPSGLDTKELGGLAADFQDLSLRRKGCYEVKDAFGTVIWKTRLPRTRSAAEIGEELRLRTLEALLPIMERDFRRGLRVVCKRCGWTTEATAALKPKAGSQAPSSSGQHQGQQPGQRPVPLPSAYQLSVGRKPSAATEKAGS